MTSATISTVTWAFNCKSDENIITKNLDGKIVALKCYGHRTDSGGTSISSLKTLRYLWFPSLETHYVLSSISGWSPSVSGLTMTMTYNSGSVNNQYFIVGSDLTSLTVDASLMGFPSSTYYYNFKFEVVYVS